MNKAIIEAHAHRRTILPNGTTVPLGDFKGEQNDNMVIIGCSGAGKTRSFVEPNIISATGSYIITDLKGTQYQQYGKRLKKSGYKIMHINFRHPEDSMKFNPIEHIKNSDDVLKISSQIIAMGTHGKDGNDPFWNNAARMLLNACIGYIWEKGVGFDNNLNGVVQLLSTIKVHDDECDVQHADEIDILFKRHQRKFQLLNNKDSWAYTEFSKFKSLSSASKTYGCILMTLYSVLSHFSSEELKNLMSGNDIDFKKIGKEKTAVFVEMSDIDRSKDVLANIFYTQAMNELCDYADSRQTHKLDIPVRFILDDFGTSCKIEGFENMISNIRSRGISTAIMIQSISQLNQGYGCSAQTILDNCDTTVFLGSNNLDTAKYIAEIINKPVDKVLRMPLHHNWIIRRGEQPVYSETVDISAYVTEPEKDIPA